MPVILFDDQHRRSLLPIVFTRPVAMIRCGILTLAEKWNKVLDEPVSFLTEPYLQEKFPFSPGKRNLYIDGGVCPDSNLLEAIDRLNVGEALAAGDALIAAVSSEATLPNPDQFRVKNYSHTFNKIRFPEDIFRLNGEEINRDFELITRGRTSASLSSTNCILGDRLFVEEGVTAECSTFNTLGGPIYLGHHSQVWEGCSIRGPFALGEQSIVKMGAKIYGMTTIGPHSKAGGEINNSVIYGNSAKGHDGYLGNSVIGEWCNIGADTNTSNMKNTYAEVKLWDYQHEGFRKTGLQFCGLVMADHSKCGINTMFNTGTVVGVSANVFGGGFPRNFVPDFSWGGSQGFEVYRKEKAFDTASRVFERRAVNFNEIEKHILAQVYLETEKFRSC